MSLTEKHHADDRHRAVPAAPPDHQGTDGGAAGGRRRRGSPHEGMSGEAAQVGLQVGRQGRSPGAREGARDTTIARGRPAESTRSRRTTLRGRAGDRGEGRVERRERRYMYNNAGKKARSPGMARDGQGRRHRMAVGLDVGTERNRDRWRCSVVLRACRGEGTTRKKARQKKTKKRGQHPAAPQGDGTEKGVWLGPRDGRRGLGQHGRRHRSEGRGREGSDPC